MPNRNDQVESESRTDTPTSSLYRLYIRVMRWLGHYRWFSLFMKHVGSQADQALIRVSRGRLSVCGPRMDTMLLTTTGRRTGKDRTVPLHYVRDGNNLVAACENFGLEVASSWPKNLLDEPRARIEIGGRTAHYVSRSATAAEVARNMPPLIEMWPAHDTYFKRSGARQVIVFEPVDAEA
jgi:deazaflavin-dependent oxidoreductase (nitroreductase family)